WYEAQVGYGKQWHEATFTGSWDAADLADMQVKIIATGGTGESASRAYAVDAVYAELHYGASGSVNQAPIVGNQTFDIDEDIANAAVVGTVLAADPNTAQSLTYAITAGNEDGVFEIDEDTGQITILSNASIDYATTA